MQHTGYAPRAGPTNGTLAWSVNFPSGVSGAETTPLIIGAHGEVFESTWALSSAGILWNTTVCGTSVLNAWALDASGTLYGACENGTVFAASSATGAVTWTLQVTNGSFFGIALGSSMLYVSGGQGYAYAVSTTGGQGRVAWSYIAGYIVGGAPALSADGATVYLGEDVSVFAMAADTGSLLWRHTGIYLLWALAVSPADHVVLAFDGGNLYALDGALGTQLWWMNSATTPAVSPAGMLFFASQTGVVYGVKTRTGAVVWSSTISTTATMYGTTLALSPTTVYTATNTALFGLDARTGAVVMNSTAGAGMASPVIGLRGLLLGVVSTTKPSRLLAIQ